MPDDPETPCEILGAVGGQSEKQLSKTLAERRPEPARLDNVFGALAESRRQDILHRLNTSRTPMKLADIADATVRCETDNEPTEIQAERERIYVSLYHHHVPMLADANLVSFDVSEKRVSPRESDEAAIQEMILER